ncbi:pentatricopeptide repeat domain-containing protein [Colletotrichum orchidophilum]|uniref:Pentatricopeptide repeat domain-containing protein n=1 Tax=Colletotrichum orchidophilum TaxID=1209926 RepID=A0A1G4AR76_9PEZI|nr:pentatricopeptide repeat domain-containing protein [Colletotrichum orchidophilum]OHE91659.1 pentatricopeptide repeat domain-containing protein [Colletotrichum orchidophilum]
MTGSRVVFDGLWRCLCPSVDTQAAARLLNSQIVPGKSLATRQRRHLVPFARHPAVRTQCRRHTTAAPSAVRAEGNLKLHDSDEPVQASAAQQTSDPEPVDDNLPDPNEQLRAAPLPAILDALQVLRGQPRSFKKVATIITYLVRARGIEMSPNLYEDLIVAAADVQGSAAFLAQLFAEMKRLQFTTTPSISHAALAALAVHPDYLLRNEILAAMKQSWTEVDASGQGHVALGLLRDGQIELAFDALETIIHKQVPIASWVYDVFIFTLAQHGFIDEAIKLAHSKVHSSDSETDIALWYMLLDSCAEAYHYEGTRYIWGRMLEKDREQLSDGVLLNIINTAARQHDFQLATGAAHLVTQRGGKLVAHHYEALLECYGGVGDIASALRVLCIMFKAISVAPYASTRPIYQRIKKEPESIDPALKTLTELVRNYKVPIAALNVIIEAAVETHGYAKALEIYQNAHKYTEATPNHVTIRYVLQACEDTEALKALVAENPELALKGDRTVFARVVYEYAVAGELDLAYKCVKLFGEAPAPAEGQQPEQSTFWINRKTLLTLVRKSLDAQDERVWWLVEQAERRNMDVQSGLSKLMASVADEIKRSSGLGQEGPDMRHRSPF